MQLLWSLHQMVSFLLKAHLSQLLLDLDQVVLFFTQGTVMSTSVKSSSGGVVFFLLRDHLHQLLLLIFIRWCCFLLKGYSHRLQLNLHQVVLFLLKWHSRQLLVLNLHQVVLFFFFTQRAFMSTSVKSLSGGVVFFFFFTQRAFTSTAYVHLHQMLLLFFYSKDTHVSFFCIRWCCFLLKGHSCKRLYIKALNIIICNVWFSGSNFH